MLAELAQELAQKYKKEGELEAKKEILIIQLKLKYGLTEDEENLILNVPKLWMLDIALDTVITGDDKQTLLKKLR